MVNERPEYGYANPQVAVNEVGLGWVMNEGSHAFAVSSLLSKSALLRPSAYRSTGQAQTSSSACSRKEQLMCTLP